MTRLPLVTSSLLALLTAPVAAVNNGLARTPQLGWNTWNAHGCDVNEQLILDSAQALVGTGLRDVGYKYVVLDDCWSDGRGTDGYVRVDAGRFPHGMKWLAEQIHQQDMLYGMYSSAGEQTCARYEGSLDWEVQDATSWASWDVDYLKYDNCYSRGRTGTPEVSFKRYDAMWQALNATGRPILYSLCSWGEDYVHSWGMSIANSWRVSGDIYDSFTRPDALCSCDDPRDLHCVSPGSHCSVLNIINKVAAYVDRGAPGGWNDMDMLEVGNGGMTDDEYVAHFSMWAVLKSPLLIGADLRKLDAKALTVMNNPAILAISQDPWGRSAIRVQQNFQVPKDKWGMGETQVWSGALSGGDQVVVFLNAADKAESMAADSEDIFGLPSAPQIQEEWEVYDLWTHRMDPAVAAEVLSSSVDQSAAFRAANWYNATEVPYSEGLQNGDERLWGAKVDTLKPGGTLKTKVPRHGVKVFRLRSTSGGSRRYSTTKDEL